MFRGASASALADLRTRVGAVSVGDSAQLGEDLFGIAQVLREEPTLRRVASEVSVSAEARAALVREVFAGKVGEPALDVLADAAGRRWVSSRDLPEGLEELAVAATVQSAGDEAPKVSDELFAAGRLIDQQAELRAALTDETRSDADRAGLLGTIFDGKVLPATERLLRQAVLGPEHTVDGALAGYQHIAAATQGELLATVRSARPLTGDEQGRLIAALSQQYAADVHLHSLVDPELVGGLRVEIGDDVIDGSVSGRLHDAQRKLAG